MDAEWAEIRRLLLPPQGGAGNVPSPVAALAFDTSQELLWAGNDYGRTSSFYGAELQRYTSFRSHPASDGPVRQILFNDKGVITLGPKSLHFALRTGPALWNITHPKMEDLQCMTFTSRGTSEILVAGRGDTMFIVDLNKGEITKEVPTEHGYRIMKTSRYICAATDKGSVNIIDSVSFKILKTWNAHTAFINDMDVREDFIVTCGASLKHNDNYMLDPFVNVFDLKNMNSISPIAFPPLAAYVRMHPRMVTTAIVVSTQGQIHIIDLMNPNTSNVKQANILRYVTKMEIAPTGEALALADSDCEIHLWGSPSKIQFTDIQHHVEWPSDEGPLPRTDWTPDTPLNMVGTPYYREPMLSSWQPLQHQTFEAGVPPKKFEQPYLDTLQKFDYGYYGPNSRGMRRNQVDDTREALEKSMNTLSAPMFLSDKNRDSTGPGVTVSASAGPAGDALALAEEESLKPEAPAMYKAVQIKFSKFGVEDFDFGYYNQTAYAGLENNIPNSYANCLLQVLHYTPMIRNLALQHAASSCLEDQCLLCELGFVFDMLHKAEGLTCQASNMLKTLNTIGDAHQARLIEEENPKGPLCDMVQSLTRFLLDRFNRDYQRILPGSMDMKQVLATSGVHLMRCMNCRSETTAERSNYLSDLKYPAPKLYPRGGKPPKITFSQILKSTVEQESQSRGWCSRCHRYQPISNRKTVTSIPTVLVLNAQAPPNTANANPEFARLWGTPGWLPEEIGIIVDQAGQFFCYEGEDLKLHLARGMHKIEVYSLIGMTINVEAPPHKPHLVSIVNVAHAEPFAPNESNWHVFNDFLVRKVSATEALTFNTRWKTPATIIFQVKSQNNKLDSEWRKSIDTSVLYMDGKSSQTYRTLTADGESPGPQTIVAIDTEFVAVKQQEIEMNADGGRETLRPMTYALARVSAVRGQGECYGEPFIDDYITINENIVDYLTIFSGITKEHLDPRVSTHNLVPLKTAYKKLWVLLNLGCKFLGHGLKTDFRVINIRVPRAQVIDTIELFYLQMRRRKLSLAFLAHYLLKEDIQLANHDSIEDARTALKLYAKYLEYCDAGILETMLHDIYRDGAATNYKPPRKDDQVVKRTDTPPIPIEGVPGPTTPARLGRGGAFGAKSDWTPGKGSPLK